MEALNLNLNLKHELLQSQHRLFDILHPVGHGHNNSHHLQSSHQIGTSSSSLPIEFMLRSFDQDEMVSAFTFTQQNIHCLQLQPQTQPNTVTVEPVSSSTTTTATTSSNSEPVSVHSGDSNSTSINPHHKMMSTTLELDPNIILQNYVNDNSDFGEGVISSGNGKERPHVCNICEASYKTRTHLRRHMMIHLQSRPYPCPDCGKGFNRKEHLSKHAEAVHSGTKHKCPFCSKEISRKDHLARHIKNMHPSYTSLLNKDGFLTDPSSLLKMAIPPLSLHGPTPQRPKSIIAPKSVIPSSSSGTRIHLKSIQPAIRVPVMHLQTGNISIRDKSQVLTSNEIHLQQTSLPETIPSQNQNQVQFDPKNVRQPGENEAEKQEERATEIILNHTAINQQIGSIPAGHINPATATDSISSTLTAIRSTSTNSSTSPSKSGKGLTPNQNELIGLTNLSRTLGGQIKEAPFANCSDPNRKLSQMNMVMMLQCPEPECDCNFTSEKDLTTHLRSHKAQNFRCTECSRAYTRREKLTEHIRCFHQGQKFKCEHCGKELSRKDHVLRHVRSIHPELLASRFNAVTSGDLSSENLGLPLSLVMDEDDHGRLTSIPSSKSNGGTLSATSTMNEMGVLLRSICQYCLKVFGTSYHLSRHIESCHNGDIRPYPCMSCSKQFKRKDHLTKHIKAHCPTLREAVSTLSQGQQSRTKTTQHGHQNFVNTNSKPAAEKHKRKPMHPKTENEAPQHLETHRLKSSEVQNSTRKTDSDNPSATTATEPPLLIAQHPLVEMELTQNIEQTSPEDEDEQEECSQDFNLAMIKSFIAANVNVDVVMGEDGEESLMLTQDIGSAPGSSSSANDNNNASSSSRVDGDHLNLHLSSSPPNPLSSQMSTFSCGHCQKEFSSKDELLDHLQDHGGDSTSAPGNNSDHGLRSIQFSNY